MPGVLELLPREQVVMQQMLDTIRAGFERFGFLPVSTPALELAEVLLTKSGGETERQVYLAQSTGARAQGQEPDLALRFDLTVPLARYVAEHQAELAFPFRRYQIQPVYRGESPQRGRFREFIQCDIDVIDRDELSIRYDAEIPAVIADVFTSLAIGPFSIRLNNRRLLRGLLELIGVGQADQQAAILRELDKLERRGASHVETALAGTGLARDQATRLLEFTGGGVARGPEGRRLVEGLPAGGPALEQGRSELLQVLAVVAQLGVPEGVYGVDLAIARGLDYYTGTVYETTLDAHPGIGSICSGGRYDDLAGLYTSSRLPGVGISIGLTRLFWQLRQGGALGEIASPVKVLVTLIDEEGLPAALQVAARLRAAGVNTESTLVPSKLGRQLRYADRSGIPLAIIAGEEERQRGTVQVRSLAATHQEEVPADLVVETVQRSLSEGFPR
jgi:histidyl-tRNA synthetase